MTVIINVSDGIACVSGQNGSSAITIDGKTIFSSNSYIGEFKEGIAVFSKKVSENSYLQGYINKNGKVIIAPKFEWATTSKWKGFSQAPFRKIYDNR